MFLTMVSIQWSGFVLIKISTSRCLSLACSSALVVCAASSCVCVLCRVCVCVCERIYVMTVGASLPVNLGNCEISNAIWMSGSSVSLADPKTFTFSYESMYNLEWMQISTISSSLSQQLVIGVVCLCSCDKSFIFIYAKTKKSHVSL